MKNKNAKKTIFKMIGEIVTWTIFALLAIVALFLIYYVLATQIYAQKGEKFKPPFSLYTIISGSMEPNIKVYDVVFDVDVKDVNTIKVGDVITFISSSNLTGGETITHRVKEVIETEEGLRFRTKGDNNPVEDDAFVEPNKILGKVLFKIPQLGRIQFLVLKSGGWLFLIIIPSLGIVIYDIIKILTLDKTKKKVTENSGAKKDNVLDKETQEKLKKEIKERLENRDKDDTNNNYDLDDTQTYKVNKLRDIAIETIENENNNPNYESNSNNEELNLDIDKIKKKIEEDKYNPDDKIELPKTSTKKSKSTSSKKKTNTSSQNKNTKTSSNQSKNSKNKTNSKKNNQGSRNNQKNNQNSQKNKKKSN